MIQRADGPQCLAGRVSALADGSLPDDVRDRALAHVTSCPDCRADLEAEQLLRARLQALPAPQPSASLVAALLAMGETGGPVPPRPGHMPGVPRPRPASIRREPAAATARTDAPWRTSFSTPSPLGVSALPWHRVAPGRRSTSRSSELPARPGPTSRPGGRAAGRRRSVVGATASAVGLGVIAAALASGLPATQRVGPVEQLRAEAHAADAVPTVGGQDVDFRASGSLWSGAASRSPVRMAQSSLPGVTTTVLRHVLGATSPVATAASSVTSSSSGTSPAGTSAGGSGPSWPASWLGATTLVGQPSPAASAASSGPLSGGYLVPGASQASFSR